MAEALHPWATLISLKVTLSATQAVLFHQNSCQATVKGQGVLASGSITCKWLMNHCSINRKRDTKALGSGYPITIAPVALLKIQKRS